MRKDIYLIILTGALLCLQCSLSLSAGGLLCRFSNSGCRRYCKEKGYQGGHCDHSAHCQCEEDTEDEGTIQKLLKKFSNNNPDFKILDDILRKIKEHQERFSSSRRTQDGKYRPLLLLLAVLYRATPVPPHRETQVSEEMLHFLGSQWYTLKLVGHLLRDRLGGTELQEIENIVEYNKMMIAYNLNITRESIALVWVSEFSYTNNITNHCPDHTLIVDHSNKQIILYIFGTRVFPTPSPQDILLDLAAHTAPFLSGEGHAGLVWATRGVISTAVPVLVDNMADFPDYKVIIAGYSLGGGIAQLLALELQTGPSSNLLPHHDNI